MSLSRDLKPEASPHFQFAVLVPEDLSAQLLPLRLTARLSARTLSAQISSSFCAVLTMVCYHSNRSN